MTRGKSKVSRATLAEVAKKANVSMTTASLVLSGKSVEQRIPSQTCKRVELAASAIGYTPNQLVHSIQNGRSNIVSFYSAFRHRYNDDLYMERMAASIEYAGSLLGYDILMHTNFWRETDEIYRFLNGGWADGLLFYAPLPDDELLPLFRKSRLPTVIVNKHDLEGALHSVCSDEEVGMSLATSALIARGHERIISFSQFGWDFRDSQERVELLDRFLAEHGINRPSSDRITVDGPVTELLRSLMARPQPPTAIFCWHDRLAYRVLEACDELGIHVPDQLTVVGYDGLHWPSSSRHVAASVKVNLSEIAVRSMSALASLIEGETVPIAQKVPVTFDSGTTMGVARDSHLILN